MARYETERRVGHSAADMFALVADIETVDGVELVEPAIQTIGPRPLDGTGDDAELIETQGPIITVNWSDAEIDGIDLVEGRAPGDGEFVIDVGAADRENLVIGEQYDMVGGETGRETFTLVGTALFGNENSLGGAILVFFSLGEGVGHRLVADHVNAVLERLHRVIEVAVVRGHDRDDISPVDPRSLCVDQLIRVGVGPIGS